MASALSFSYCLSWPLISASCTTKQSRRKWSTISLVRATTIPTKEEEASASREEDSLTHKMVTEDMEDMEEASRRIQTADKEGSRSLQGKDTRCHDRTQSLRPFNHILYHIFGLGVASFASQLLFRAQIFIWKVFLLNYLSEARSRQERNHFELILDSLLYPFSSYSVLLSPFVDELLHFKLIYLAC